ncbi:nucleotidyltransferase family protein [Rhodocyclaceae bacterium SMB388]
MTKPAEVDSETINAARAFSEKVASRYPLSRVILFGSRARKTHGPHSDADIAVLLRGQPCKFVATKLALADIAYETE